MQEQEGLSQAETPLSDGAEGKKSKKTTRIVCICMGVLIALVFFFVGWFSRYYALDDGIRDFLWAKGKAEDNYYKEIDEDKLYSDIMDALESQLDQYSRFYTADEYAEVVEESKGHNTGVGVSIVEEEGAVRIYSVVENSPAQRKGIAPAMYVTGMGTDENALTALTSASQLSNWIKERTGDFILKCGYEADGSDGVLYTLERKAYTASYVLYRDREKGFSFRGEGEDLFLTDVGNPLPALDEKTAYIRIVEFNANVVEEFRLCLEKMKERGRSNLILDLRGNGGGYLDLLCEVSQYLLRNGEGGCAVLKAKYKNGDVATYKCDEQKFDDYFTAQSRIRILADENTASASECLIGAMIDYGTTHISDVVLRKDPNTGIAKSYGKGIMQTHFTSFSGEAMKLTTATVHWPQSDRCIHDKGVTEADGATAISAPALERGDTLLEELLS